MDIDDQELLQEFVLESREHLSGVESQLLAIEQRGADIDVELVNTVFRQIHSIKGAAGFLGLTNVNTLSHCLENVLNKMRNLELVPSSSTVDVMLKAADKLNGMINHIEQSDQVNVEDLCKSLNQIADSSEDKEREPASKATSAMPAEPPPVPQLTHEQADAVVDQETSLPPSDQEPPHQDDAALPEASAAKNSNKSTSVGVDTSIRVPVGVLDQLMNLAGELVLSRNQLLQTVATAKHPGLDVVASGLDQVTSELQEAIMQTRMQPIGNVFNRFRRVVRDLSGKLNKQCELSIDGADVEVDKSILEAISDPLTHLIRNSIDHGIEIPEVRARNGKAASGTLQLKAFHQAGKVCISIRDDGAGIDPQKLKDKAVNKGLMTQDRAAQMEDREAIRLIFHPGFSTAAVVTDVSGRGVGMDVVRANIEKLSGTIEVSSTIGEGTSIDISLPSTLAIIPSLIVESLERRFAIPQANIVELVRVRASELEERIGRVKDAEVLRLRGSLLPLVRLQQVLNQRPSGSTLDERVADQASDEQLDQAVNIIVAESGQFRYGLMVDNLHDSEEIVVKPLGTHLKECRCLAGATILGDGHVALIVDIAGIAAQCQLENCSEQEQSAEYCSDGSGTEETQSVLLFANDPTEQFALPMTIVSRIERVTADQIDSVGGMQLLQYRGSTMPLLNIEDLITAKPKPQQDRLFIIVFSIADYEIGLIASQLTDIRDVTMNVDTVTLQERGVIGSVIVDGLTTRLLDVFELAESAHPEWFRRERRDTKSDDRKPHVLLAEDSGFFREHVSSFLKKEGFEVIPAEDGQIAWNMLSSPDEPLDLDLVITDIEMPNLNGFDLTRRIKESSNLEHLPVIALTSLASDEDRQTGQAAGVDDYQVKMDRENLLAAINKCLKSNVNYGRTTTPGVMEMRR